MQNKLNTNIFLKIGYNIFNLTVCPVGAQTVHIANNFRQQNSDLIFKYGCQHQ